MRKDIVSDALNQIMNAKRIGKEEVKISVYSNLLLELFKIMKESKYIDFKTNDTGDGKPNVVVKILRLNKCRAIKPRFYVGINDIDKYLRRFLPSRTFGSLIISTNKGLMNQDEAYENKTGGSLIAYFY